MSTFRNPVGPQPSRVYWRRRIVVGLGLLAVIIVIVLIVVRPGSGEPTNNPTGGPPAVSPSPSPSGTAEPGTGDDADAAACDPAKVTVEGIVSSRSFEGDEQPMLSLSVKSTATEPCTIEAGSDVQEFRITSGSDLIWSSKDCQTDAEPRLQLLRPGVPVATTPIPWDRTRSSADTCDEPRDPVVADGASYHLEVTLGDHTSSNDTQFILY